jgi:DNA-binding beta-propeller fold protein YncE
LYISTLTRLAAIDLISERIVWEKTYDGHCCDRLDVSPDGATIYAPAFGRPRWYVINASDGTLITTIDVTGFPRQAIYSRDGRRAFLGAWESAVISVVDTGVHKVIKEIGPFGRYVCPFTINRRETFAFVNIDGLIGFEVADLQTGLVLDRVPVQDKDDTVNDAVTEYECPSHGIALTPDDGELWVADGVRNRIHVFDAKTYPPVPARVITLRTQPRWITFSIDGQYAYVSTGDVIDRASGKIVATLADERGVGIRSEKMLEVDFSGGSPVRAGRQTGGGLP